MTTWLGFGIFNVLVAMIDIYKQGYCKAIDLLSALVLFVAGPFGTGLILLHRYAGNIDHAFERIIWKRKSKSYNDFLEDYEEKKYGKNRK